MTYEREQSEDILTYNMQNQTIYCYQQRERESERIMQTKIVMKSQQSR